MRQFRVTMALAQWPLTRMQAGSPGVVLRQVSVLAAKFPPIMAVLIRLKAKLGEGLTN
jgi:hypothetical protein